MLVETVLPVDRALEPTHAVVEEDDRLRAEFWQERKIVEPGLLRCVMTIHHKNPDFAEVPVGDARDELLRGRARVPHVRCAESGEMLFDARWIKPEVVHERRINEKHLARLRVVRERLANDGRHEASPRADHDGCLRPDHAPQRVIEPSEPEVQVVAALRVPHPEHFGVSKQLRYEIVHSIRPLRRATGKAQNTRGFPDGPKTRGGKFEEFISTL